jgi:LemA protein
MNIFLIVMLLITVYVVVAYNRLVSSRNRMQEAWSGIDVYLKKRHDLVPNLVETVKGYAAHEQQTINDIIRLRSRAMDAQSRSAQIETEKGLGGAISRLMLFSEAYPDLKANVNFLMLQRQLSELEEDLSLSRRYYNGTVREYNIKNESFPSNIVAGMFGFEKGIFFEIRKSESIVPNVIIEHG